MHYKFLGKCFSGLLSIIFTHFFTFSLRSGARSWATITCKNSLMSVLQFLCNTFISSQLANKVSKINEKWYYFNCDLDISRYRHAFGFNLVKIQSKKIIVKAIRFCTWIKEGFTILKIDLLNTYSIFIHLADKGKCIFWKLEIS